MGKKSGYVAIATVSSMKSNIEEMAKEFEKIVKEMEIENTTRLDEMNLIVDAVKKKGDFAQKSLGYVRFEVD